MGKAQSDSGSTHNYNDVFNPTTRLLNILVLRTSAILRSLHSRAHANRISEKDSVLQTPAWTPDHLKGRQETLLATLGNLWRLGDVQQPSPTPHLGGATLAGEDQ
jgi:hypothetical protein